MKFKRAFTLIELLIIVALLAILFAAIIIFFNPKYQITKTWDAKRKKELDTLKKVFEEFYTDKNCYPKPEQVCQNSPQKLTSTYVCEICGGSLEGYLNNLPCDPQTPSKKYLYEVDNTTCPTFYKIYTTLSNKEDPTIEELGCNPACLPEGYNPTSEEEYFTYGVSSPNTSINSNYIEPFVQWACKIIDPNTSNFICDPCCYGNYNCPQGINLECYNALNNQGYTRIYGSKDECQNSCIIDY